MHDSGLLPHAVWGRVSVTRSGEQPQTRIAEGAITMGISIRDLANQTDTQEHEIAAFLDLGDWTPSTEISAEHEALWRDGLDEKA